MMQQKIYPDLYGIDTWDQQQLRARLRAHPQQRPVSPSLVLSRHRPQSTRKNTQTAVYPGSHSTTKALAMCRCQNTSPRSRPLPRETPSAASPPRARRRWIYPQRTSESCVVTIPERRVTRRRRPRRRSRRKPVRRYCRLFDTLWKEDQMAEILRVCQDRILPQANCTAASHREYPWWSTGRHLHTQTVGQRVNPACPVHGRHREPTGARARASPVVD